MLGVKCLRNSDSNPRPEGRGLLTRIKSLADRRIGNLRDERHIIAIRSQKLTCKLLGVKDLNDELYCCNTPYDHDRISRHISIMIGSKLADLYGMIPQTKVSNYHPRYRTWDIQTESELDKYFDIAIIWCINKDKSGIDRCYIIPKEEIITTMISIYKNPTDSHGNPKTSWYGQYRVTDDEFIKRANDIWKEMTEQNSDARGYSKQRSWG